jgi:hypothetical protein
VISILRSACFTAWAGLRARAERLGRFCRPPGERRCLIGQP